MLLLSFFRKHRARRYRNLVENTAILLSELVFFQARDSLFSDKDCFFYFCYKIDNNL